LLLVRRVRWGLQVCEHMCDRVGPGPVAGEAEVAAAARRHEVGGGAEQSQPQAFGLPAAGGPGQGELGLKGTISEAELHLIKQRMWNGRIGKARRGELAVPPAGGLSAPPGRSGRA
jgi:hypothetical protein